MSRCQYVERIERCSGAFCSLRSLFFQAIRLQIDSVLALVFVLGFFLLTDFATAQDWNQFRGPNHDNKSTVTGIAKSWPAGGPKLLWKVDHLGAGYGNISFHGDKMYALGDLGDDCCLTALERATGKKLWSKPLGPAGQVGRYFGPRSTPAVDGKLVFAYGQFGDFVCFDAQDGTEIWGGNVAEEFGGRFMNNWGFSSSPILDGELVLLPIGGRAGTVMAFHKNGQRAWRTTEIKDDAPYGSVVPATFLGKKQYLLFSMSGVWSINPEDGKVLWLGAKSADRAICSDPVVWAENAQAAYVLASMAYGVGTTGFLVTEQDGKMAATQTFYEKPLENHHGGLILHDGYVYMTTNRDLLCVDIKTGKTVWQNGAVGKGSVSFVDGHLIVRSEKGDGTMVLVEATPEGYREKGRFDQPDRSDKNSWTYPVIVDGKMYVRDQNVLLCYDLMGQ